MYALLPRIFDNTFMTLKASFRYVHLMYMFVLEKLVHFDIPWSRYRCLQGALSCIQFFKYFGQNYESLGVSPSYGKSRSRLLFHLLSLLYRFCPINVPGFYYEFTTVVQINALIDCIQGLKGTRYILG